LLTMIQQVRSSLHQGSTRTQQKFCRKPNFIAGLLNGRDGLICLGKGDEIGNQLQMTSSFCTWRNFGRVVYKLPSYRNSYRTFLAYNVRYFRERNFAGLPKLAISGAISREFKTMLAPKVQPLSTRSKSNFPPSNQ